MKRILLYTGVIAAAAALLVLCFFSPALVERRMDKRNNDVRILDATEISVAAPSSEILNEAAMLAGRENVLSATEFEEGTVYSYEKAVQHARDLLVSCASDADLPVTQEFLGNGADFIADAHVTFYLYEKDGLPHSALLWFCRLSLPGGDMQACITFDDATGMPLEISLPVYESFGPIEFLDPESGDLRYLSSLAAAVYAGLSDLAVEELQWEEPDSTYDKSISSYHIVQAFSFRMVSAEGQSVPVYGRWELEDGKGIHNLTLTLSPNPDTASPASADEPLSLSGQ